MKYTVIAVSSSKVPYTESGYLKGTRYDAVYEAEYWSWRKFKMVTDIKHAFRLPMGPAFRDSETGEFVNTVVDNRLEAYIAVHLKT